MTKKANGVYYTPSPVVDYIVRTTLDPLLEAKSPMQLAGRTASWRRDSASHPLAILDPACGTGYFLLGAYQFLLDWCRDWYCEHDAERWLSGPHRTLCRDGRTLCLRAEERQRILRDHIFGVDIDEQAIEIAKRSLHLRMFASDVASEAAAAAVSSDQLAADCLDNLRCGNSLIGSDFHEQQQHIGDNQAVPQVKVFDWEVEFAAVLAAGGFDAIIGNPPYVNARLVKQHQGEAIKQYYRQRYGCARRAFDLYVLFVERSQQLLRRGGRAGVIVPNKIATLDYARPCRELLLNNTAIDTITDVSDQPLFRDASVYPYIITWTKRLADPDHHVRIVSEADAKELPRAQVSHVVRQSAWSGKAGLVIQGTLDIESRVTTLPLSQRASIQSGTTGFSAEQMADTLREQSAANVGQVFDFIVSGNIDRYAILPGNVRFMKRTFARPVLSTDADILTQNKRALFSNSKIVIAGMSRRLEAAWDASGLALGVQVYAVADLQDDPRFLLGLLNSRLMSYLLRTRFQAKRLAGGYLAINKGQLAQLPIRIVAASDATAAAQGQEIIECVDQVVRHRQPIDAVDYRIDRLVYKLYQLTETEIEAVELTVSAEPPRGR